MKKVLVMGILAMAMVLGFIQSASAADATVAMDLNSAYVWRGITFNDGLVLQPSIDVSKGGFGLNVWGNMDLDDYDNSLESGEFSEIDLTLSYAFDLEPVGVTIGLIEYLFPGTDEDEDQIEGTREIFLSLGMDLFEGLGAGLDIYYDFDEVEEYYISLSLGYSVALSETTSLDFGAAAGYAGEEYDADGADDAGFHDYLLSIGLSYAATESLSMGASINYTNSFDDDMLPDQDTDFFGGVSIAYTF